MQQHFLQIDLQQKSLTISTKFIDITTKNDRFMAMKKIVNQ
jgi:hypothetical protein